MSPSSAEPGRAASEKAALNEVGVAAHLSELARQQPDGLAVIVQQGTGGYLSRTYQQLDRESGEIARGLNRAGITRGTRTALMVQPGVEFFALAFALFKAGAVPVLIDPGIGLNNLKRCLAESAPDVFLGSPPAHAARVLGRWAPTIARPGGRAMAGASARPKAGRTGPRGIP